KTQRISKNLVYISNKTQENLDYIYGRESARLVRVLFSFVFNTKILSLGGAEMEISAVELKKIRKVYRLTLEQMAELLGISAGHLSHVENGHYRLTEKVKARL